MSDPLRAREAELSEILARLEKATGPDRIIDAAIYRAVNGIADTASVGWAKVPHFTASIDAALALVERVAPYLMVVNLCEWEAKALRERGKWTCTLKRHGTQDDFTAPAGHCRHARTAPLAILIATLRALSTIRSTHP